MLEISERSFCDGLEMKLPSPSGGIQQTGAPETIAKSVTPSFYLRLVTTSALIQLSTVFNYHQLPHGAKNLR